MMRDIHATSPSSTERLAFFVEEVGEALHMLGKTLRHGWESSHPDYQMVRNRDNLETEIGQLLATIELLMRYDLSSTDVHRAMRAKWEKMLQFVHSPQNVDLIKELIVQYDAAHAHDDIRPAGR